MEEKVKFLVNPLKELNRLSGAKWMLWLFRRGETWYWGEESGFSVRRKRALTELLDTTEVTNWLAGALASNHSRRRKTGENEGKIGCAKLYAFPNRTIQALLLVGADELRPAFLRFLGGLAHNGPYQPSTGTSRPENQVLFRPLEFGLEPSYDLQGMLQQVVKYLLEAVPAHGAYIALRTGDIFVVRAEAATPKALGGMEIRLREEGWLQQMVEERRGMILPRGQQKSGPHRVQNGAAWMAAPVVLGQRVTGYAAFYADKHHPFTPEILVNAEAAVSRAAHLIENAMIFSEAARYLQQLALVNELAAAASSGSDIDEVARRVLERLRRVFADKTVTLLLISSDGHAVREYGVQAETATVTQQPLEETLAGYVVETARPLRVGKADELPQGLEMAEGVRSRLCVPMRYRGKVIGVLDLTAAESQAFSVQDEQLLVMLASHLAGLIENAQLNDETRRRARNLSLIHQVVRRVVGLTEPAQIAQVAAVLMSEQFDYDFSAVLLQNEHEDGLYLAGIAGYAPMQAEFGKHYTNDTQVIGEVMASGESRLLPDLAAAQVPHPITGLKRGSELCVPLIEGDHFFGVIDAVRIRPNAFTENDQLALEALAGVLCSVMMNASRYQQLQTSVRQLEAARETALEIAGDLDLELLLRRVVRRAREMIGARGAELALVDEQAEIVRTVVSENPWRDFTGSEAPFMSGVEGKVAVLGEPVVVSDYNGWSGRLYPERLMPYRSVAGIPLKLRGKVIGVLLVSDDRPEREFHPEDLQLLEFFAAQAAIFIHNARMYQEIQERMEAQREAEMQLVASARLAAVGEMAAGVAHELNNPLTTVAGFIELVLDDLPTDSTMRQDLELVLRESRRARGVVRRLLDFSRPSDNIRIRTDVNELVSEVLTLVQHLIRTNGVELRVQLWDELPWISIDPNQIKQVLLNLVHNALQAMPKGGTLTVATDTSQRDGKEYLTVSVRDSGVGIKTEHLERIFEPFFTTRPVGSGTGLGLSVSYGIATEHGGFLEVDSTPGEGSNFTVWLPVDNHE